ncbi:MAG: Mini-ribonuclease 3 [Mogibacterium sp.]|nr:Mini-ribonuclease 3 [Mogibacterium sp.]
MMEKRNALMLNTSTLAYMGDAVYELAIRKMLIERDASNVHKSHKKAIKYVSADGQATAAKKMIADGYLTEEEERLLKRARNHRTTSMPKNAEVKTYKTATGFEALIGYLYLSEQNERLDEVITRAVAIIEE